MSTENEPVIAHPASSVVVVRDAEGGPEILYLRRNARLAFHGGSWVFPGGRIDAEDHGRDGEDGAARRAAAREAHEEAGLEIEADALRFLCHWTTPVTSPKRFATWFFIGGVGDHDVTVDGGEIHDHRWLKPADALAAQRAGHMGLPAPAFALSTRLQGHETASSLLAEAAAWPSEHLLPKIHHVDGGRVALYQQDAGYAENTITAPGARHRMWMIDSGWRYERDF